MLKEIWHALRGKDALSDMVAEVADMLESGEWMFDRASTALMSDADWSEVADELYERDRHINDTEQKVREMIVSHLSVGNKADLSPCLVLMSVVKDAERIGDYCKNIFEIAKFYRREYTRPEYATTLQEVQAKVSQLFGEARKAFVEGDRPLAYEVQDVAGTLRGRCDVVIRQLLSVQGEIAPDEAVAYVLTARFYKRVAAHLANIASAVVSPVPLIDYRGKRPEPDES